MVYQKVIGGCSEPGTNRKGVLFPYKQERKSLPYKELTSSLSLIIWMANDNLENAGTSDPSPNGKEVLGQHSRKHKTFYPRKENILEQDGILVLRLAEYTFVIFVMFSRRE